MATYKVEEHGTRWYVRGLPSDFGGYPDTMLIYHYRYPESETPDVDNPSNAEQMLGALYDLYQTHSGLREGDRFETPFGNFVCVSVHVVPEDEAPGGHGRHR